MTGLSAAQSVARSCVQSEVAHSPAARPPVVWRWAVVELVDMFQLLSPDVRAIAIAAPTPQRDRAPDWVASGTPARLRDDLKTLLGGDRVLSRPIDLVRYATDASPYRLFPKVVVIAQNVEDVRKALAYARRC